jgi:predicted nucleotidyltransferase
MQIKTGKIFQMADQMKQQFPEICFAYLFGSAATGKLSGGSDIDIAIYLGENVDKLKLLPALIGFAEGYFPGRVVDVVILNESGELIAMEALKGKILFIKDEFLDLHAGFYSITCRKCEDRLIWMKRQLNYRGYEVQWSH